MTPVEVRFLADVPGLAPILARWHHAQWGGLYTDWTLEVATEELIDHTTRRAMPTTAPGSLTNDEVYALTAFLLHANGIIDAGAVMNKASLPKVAMPAKKYFVPDTRTQSAGKPKK